MSQPRTRAERTRLVAASQSQGVVNEDNVNVMPDAWFAYVLPVQMGTEMIGAGRYGYWNSQPHVEEEGDSVVITGMDDETGEEPILIVPKATMISLFVAQAKHIDATPFAVVELD
jgi:hypothetical protein